MFTSRQRVMRALCHEPLDRVPRDLWVSPATAAFRPDEVSELLCRYPVDVVRPEFAYPRGQREQGKPNRSGQYTDPWGCTWQLEDVGTQRRLIGSPLSSAAQMAKYEPPMEILEKANLATVDDTCRETAQFVVAPTETRPLDRLRWLRGETAAKNDLRRAGKSLRALLAALDAFSCREMELWAETAVDAVEVADHPIGRDGPVVPLDVWRDLFKPLYARYCQIIHEADKFVLFRTSGNIEPIVPDLVEVGVDAVQVELDLVELSRLAERFRGQIAFWVGLSPAESLHQATPEQIRQMIRQVRQLFDEPHGGIVAWCQWEPHVRFRIVTAFFEQWLEPVSTSPATSGESA